VVQLSGTISESEEYENRNRLCDLGYLRFTYRRPDGQLGYRCPSEDPDNYAHKGGASEEAVGRKCLCNGLLSAIGLPQIQSGDYVERPIVTAGDDVKTLSRFMKKGELSYSAEDVIHSLLQPAT
jgi:nitronate monooxygenase